MAAASGLAWAGPAVLLVGRFGLGLPARPAFWLTEVLGSARAADIAAVVQQVLSVLALLTVSVQGALGSRRHPLHRPLAWVALPLWVLTWVTTLFGYLG